MLDDGLADISAEEMVITYQITQGTSTRGKTSYLITRDTAIARNVVQVNIIFNFIFVISVIYVIE